MAFVKWATLVCFDSNSSSVRDAWSFARGLHRPQRLGNAETKLLHQRAHRAEVAGSSFLLGVPVVLDDERAVLGSLDSLR